MAPGWAGCPGGEPVVARRPAPRHDRLRSDDPYLIRLGTLGALSDLELDPLVLLQRPVTGRVDRGEVNEDVRSPTVHRDEAETLLRVEPLDRALRHSPAPLLPVGDGLARCNGHPAGFAQRCWRPSDGAGAQTTYRKTRRKHTRSGSVQSSGDVTAVAGAAAGGGGWPGWWPRRPHGGTGRSRRL